MSVKLTCWNIEWMNDLFDKNGDFHPDDHKPQHSKSTTVRERRNQIAGVLSEIDSDVIVVIEGPNRTKELQAFFDTDVNGSWSTHIQTTKGSTQCIGIAIRTDTNKFDPAEPVKNFNTQNEERFGEFHLDNERDGITEIYKFERRPLYSEITLASGKKFRVLGLHLKSKGIFNSLEWSRWWEKSLSNRRKIFASAVHLREHFIEPYLLDPQTKDIPLIVCGDINDGPGFDTSERKITGSSVEKLMGDIWKPEFILGNAIYDTEQSLELSTTLFSDPIFNNTYHRVWIDHILYTKNVSNYVSNGRIIKDMTAGKIWKIYPHASDHQPVCVDIDLSMTN